MSEALRLAAIRHLPELGDQPEVSEQDEWPGPGRKQIVHRGPVDAERVCEDEVMERDDRRCGHADGGDKLPLDAGKAQADRREPGSVCA